jgi:hypothetical protein
MGKTDDRFSGMQNLIPEVLVPRTSDYLQKNTPQYDFLVRTLTTWPVGTPTAVAGF